LEASKDLGILSKASEECVDVYKWGRALGSSTNGRNDEKCTSRTLISIVVQTAF
jgi:hypothetical protein